MIKLSLALVIGLLTFSAFSEPIYANCKDTADGYACDLVGYKWGRQWLILLVSTPALNAVGSTLAHILNACVSKLTKNRRRVGLTLSRSAPSFCAGSGVSYECD